MAIQSAFFSSRMRMAPVQKAKYGTAGLNAKAASTAASPGAASRLFLALWAQVWSLQLMKEWHILRSKTPSPLGAAVVLVLAGAVVESSLLAFSQRRVAPRAARLAVAGLVYCALRGSSSNHIVLQGLVCVLTLESYLRSWRRACDDAFGDALAAGARALLGALYFVTAVAKCNDDWVDAEASCAVLYTVAGGVEVGIKWWPAQMLAWLPYGALAGEFGLAGALLVADRMPDAARLVLVTTAAVFHVGLATPRPPLSVYPFSMLMAPLFAAADAWPWPSAVVSAEGALLLAIAFSEMGETSAEYPPYGSWRVGLAWCIFAFQAVVGRAYDRVRRGTPEDNGRPARRFARPAVLAAVLTLAVGAAPYLGLRTHPTFGMFSNLRVEEPSNHWFLGRFAARGFDKFAGGAVRVDATSLPAVASLNVDLGRWLVPHTAAALRRAGAATQFFIAPPAAQWPPNAFPAPSNHDNFATLNKPVFTYRHELRRRIADALPKTRGAFFVDYVDGAGEQRRFERFDNGTLSPGSDADLAKPLQPLQALLFRYRPFDQDVSPCRH